MSRITLNGWLQYDPTIFDGVILPEDYDRDALLAEIISRSGELYTYHQVPYVLKENIRLWFSRNFLNFDRMMAALMAEYNPIENYDRHEDWTRTPNLTDEAKHTGSDSVEASGTDSTEASGTDTDTLSGNDTTTRGYNNYNESSTRTGDDTTERTVSAFDSGTYQPAEKTVETFGSVKDSKDITGSYDDSTDYGKVDTMDYGRKDETTYGRKDETTFNSTLTDRHTGDEKYTSHIHGNIGVTTSQQMITSELELRKFDIYEEIAGRFEHEFLVQVY